MANSPSKLNLLGKLKAGFGGKSSKSSATPPAQLTDVLGFNVPAAAGSQYMQAAAARDAKAAKVGLDGDGDDGMWTMIRNYDEADAQKAEKLKAPDRATAYSKLAWAGVEPLSKEERPMLWYAAVGAGELACDPDEHPYSYYEELSRTDLDDATAKQIEKDVPRTFADSHPKFSPVLEGGNEKEGSLLQPLDRLLRSVMVAHRLHIKRKIIQESCKQTADGSNGSEAAGYNGRGNRNGASNGGGSGAAAAAAAAAADVVDDEDVGCQYWQGLNFVGGFLLLVYDGNEVPAFWVMRCMLEQILDGVYGASGPRVELDLLDVILRERLPLMCKHMRSHVRHYPTGI